MVRRPNDEHRAWGLTHDVFGNAAHEYVGECLRNPRYANSKVQSDVL